MGDPFVSINESSASHSKKRIIHINVVEITNVQHTMLSVVFEGYVVNKYGFYNAAGSGFKHIHNDLTNPLGYSTLTLTIGFTFVITFSPHLNVG
jgi:hypothetical protein